MTVLEGVGDNCFSDEVTKRFVQYLTCERISFVVPGLSHRHSLSRRKHRVSGEAQLPPVNGVSV